MNSPVPHIRRPPGPDHRVAPAIDRQTLELLRHLQQKFGNVIMMTTPNGCVAVFINAAQEVRQLLVRRYGKYRKRPGFERVKMLLGIGLIVSDGASWRRSRTRVQPAFSRQNVHRMIGMMVQCCEGRLETWEVMARREGRINITQETSDCALEVVLRAIFGPDYERWLMQDGNNAFAFLSQDSVRDFRVVTKMRELREFLLRIIAERRARSDTDRCDFLSIYLTACPPELRGTP